MEIKITPITHSNINNIDLTKISFGEVYADHMYMVDYIDGQWENPQILPYAPIALSPATSAIHYGQAIFEGMKAYKDADGTPQLFRPLDNHARLNKSARRLCMPELPEELFMEGLNHLVRMDNDWIPTAEGSGLYMRPFMFATDDFIGVRASERYRFMIICCPVNEYYQEPLRIKVETNYVRAFDGGVGFAKAAGNYASAMLPTKLAKQEGYHQVIWMDGKEHKYIEESGTTNLFFIVDGKVLTPALDGNILEGITRDSCIQLLKDKGLTVEERKVSIDEIVAAAENGTLQDAFGTGTAATVAPIACIHYQGKDHNLPDPQTREHSPYLYKRLEDIKTGKVADTHNWIYQVSETTTISN